MRAVISSIIFVAGLWASLPGQQLSPTVLAPAGDVSRNSRLQLEWTLGEVAVDGITGHPESFTEGFHQPLLNVEKDLSQGSPHSPTITSCFGEDIMVAPNPVTSTLMIRMREPFESSRHLMLMDPAGTSILQSTIPAGSTAHTLDLSALPSGIYYLYIRTAYGANAEIYKISKIQ